MSLGRSFEEKHKQQSKESEKNSSRLPNISSNQTISMIQTALQPEIEKRLDARRKMDKLALEALLLFSDSNQSSSKHNPASSSPETQERNVYKKHSSGEED